MFIIQISKVVVVFIYRTSSIVALTVFIYKSVGYTCNKMPRFVFSETLCLLCLRCKHSFSFLHV